MSNYIYMYIFLETFFIIIYVYIRIQDPSINLLLTGFFFPPIKEKCICYLYMYI
ncbi:hypothetical protein GLOIN_2v385718 [Rhizophagus irregularis DAOM 181602=DAOM 197198]|uniref:Uncharacterized protein n=1 Tax=Rhizophagus irregularis (strain DAOM 181602 / DAOM 197198 / MUCL 43194) TaxID=747089 RepID=A0A2P4QQV6_RHIID|nr:hypothetical protein GLOIN_2v385718 [Rhizophagus irregularis DAOM 181602=DAOM 197198]POG80039.1 hypothetical protein GLOIN_2v385718 [Rhizophagus irregularis DAOM 181602=DAOM 197198]|eukprot:XP_025186905.1 hypothetical protein GLOIN_2v385718 [Rhizophagus irregularis DAOM 181602=DAOM 197198]